MPFTMLTTAITEVTPITTPRSVSTLRNLCAHRLPVAMRTASPKAIVVLVAIEVDRSLLLYVRDGKLLSSRARVSCGEGLRHGTEPKPDPKPTAVAWLHRPLLIHLR